MKRVLLAACVSMCTAFAPREEVPAPRAFARPPLQVVAKQTVLVHGHPSAIPGAHRVAILGGEVERWDFDDALTAEETVARAESLAARGVDVELDLEREAQETPNDEGFPKQWALGLLKATEAWKVTTGDATLTVAVIDTGFVDHPDFEGRLAPGYDFITDPASAGDGDGRDADAHDAGDEREASSSFHGPHISGIIGATTNNGLGMAGVDWACKLQPVRVLGVRRHRGRDSDIADGIRWAAGLNIPGIPQNKTPARIVNLSFGGPGFSRVLQDAISAAHARGVLVIASAGNNAEDASANVPASLEGVMSVAAAGPDGKLASYSNWGLRVDLMTPGGALFLDEPVANETPGAIWSTSFVRGQSQPVFAFAAGTSQAAAYATGVAALVRSAAPSLGPDVVAAVMRRASTVPAVGCENGCGAGLLDASRAVRYARKIEEATCGVSPPLSRDCGFTNALPPAPLKPEEGCSTASGGGGGAGNAWPIGLALLCVVLRRQRLRASALALLALAVGCSSSSVDRESESQSNAPVVVKLVDPVPTFDGNELSVSVGGGRSVTVSVTPATSLDRVEMRLTDPELVIGRVAHAPFEFFVPAWVPGEGGRRLVCITAYDARGREGETCFLAIP